MQIYSLAFSGSTVFAGSPEGGVYVSADTGKSWRDANEGLTDLRVNVLVVAGTMVFAGTQGGGVFGRDLEEVISGVTGEPFALPGAFILLPNYPNPFNPETTIQYILPYPAEVKLSIYNLLGQEVATLFNGRLAAGTHTVLWKAGGSPSGMYVCNLTSGAVVLTRKMVLTR